MGRGVKGLAAGAIIVAMMLIGMDGYAQGSRPMGRSGLSRSGKSSDSTTLTSQGVNLPENTWALDILISNDGFGLGTTFRHQFNEDIHGTASFSVSESKDSREFERVDPFTGLTFVPGKLNRFMVLPLMFGMEYRLFREDIVDTFRPYVNAAAGPTMIYVMPYTEITVNSDGTLSANDVDFFKSIGRGHPHYTLGGYIGFGANFGTERTSVFGVNFRYYFTYLFSGGLPSLYDPATGSIAGTKNDFGGFFITLNIGMGL
jgi:hypothetical protein